MDTKERQEIILDAAESFQRYEWFMRRHAVADTKEGKRWCLNRARECFDDACMQLEWILENSDSKGR